MSRVGSGMCKVGFFLVTILLALVPLLSATTVACAMMAFLVAMLLAPVVHLSAVACSRRWFCC